MTEPPSITRLLVNWSNGDRAALEELTPQVQPQLHALARTYLSRGRRNQTLQPTALINEVYLRLIDQSEPIQWECRAHFFAIAARLMRHILVDYARAHRAVKRGGEAVTVTLDEMVALSPSQAPDLLDVDQALTRLEQWDQRKGKVIELRYFGGMRVEEIATACGLTTATVKRDLRLGEAWLRRDLRGEA
jgi:RNA polymerase sigma factor (TIGR02999 family)